MRSEPDPARQPERAADVLADALKRAIDRRHWPHATRLADTALRLETRSDELVEQMARLRLAQGNIEGALRLLESIQTRNGDQRMLRAVCLVAMGGGDEARSELAMARADATQESALLTSMLETEAGAHGEALCRLEAAGNLPGDQALDVALLTTLLHCEHGSDQALAASLESLRRLAVFPHLRRMIRIALASLEPQWGLRTESEDETMVEQLADELAAAEEMISTLLAAQRVAFDAPSARLLLRALMRLADRREQEASGSARPSAEIYAAIVELAERLDGRVIATRWLERGLKAHPMSAVLQRTKRELAGDVPPEPPVEIPARGGGVISQIGLLGDARGEAA